MSFQRTAVRIAPALHAAARLSVARAAPVLVSRSVRPVQQLLLCSRRTFFTPPGSKSGAISTQPSPDGKGTIPVVLVGDYKKIANEFDAIIDVREPKELVDGAIPGSVNIPLGNIEADPNQTQFKDKKVLVYCRAGIRSAKAVAAMQKHGIHAVNLGGGFLAWQGDQ
jgi:rhodanese-related sulfurtransferase